MTLEIKDMNQTQFIEYVRTKMCKESWITVFKSNELISQFCALIPKKLTKKALKKPYWDIEMGKGGPSIIYERINDEMVCAYQAITSKNRVEPLIIQRYFSRIIEGFEEVSKDFELFHNLLYDKEKGNYYAILINGDLEEVIRYKKLDREIQIKASYLHKYISARQKNLAIFFERKAYENELATPNLYQDKEIIYNLNSFENPCIDFAIKSPYLSILTGKKIIYCLEWNDASPPKEYEKFIIGQDEKGEDILYECNPNKLSNYYGSNPGCPNYVTPVFFKREVLSKYYNVPKLYTVVDNQIECGGLWRLRIDNNHEKYVIVHLGDLGGHLPDIKEQKYWRSYNIAPDGQWSKVFWKRGFEAQFTDPSSPDLLFKQRFNTFLQKWKDKKGWDLFLPLSCEDQYCFTSLHIPNNTNHKEFDQEIANLSKVLVDSINQKKLEAEIRVLLGHELSKEEQNYRGIKKLNLYLSIPYPNIFDQYMNCLRYLQDIRSSSSAHRKGDNYKKIMPAIQEKGFEGYFQELLTKFIEFFEKLTESFEL